MSDGKRGPGRPALPEREQKKNFLSFAVTDAEKRSIEQAAKRAGMSRNSWLREITLAATKKLS
jgi:anti-sigma factor RsiW